MDLEQVSLQETVLGTVMLYHEHAAVAVQWLRAVWEDAWTTRELQLLGDVILRLFDAGTPVDIVTVQRQLEQEGQPDGIEAVRHAQAAAEAGDLLETRAQTLLAYTQLRAQQRAIEWAQACLASGIRDVSEFLTEFTDRVASSHTGGMRPYSAAQVIDEIMEAYERIKRGDVPTGVPTGLANIDRATGGLPYGTLTVLGGRPSHGTSALGTQIALNAAGAGVPVVIFNHEPARGQSFTRMVCQHARLALQSAMFGRLNRATEERHRKAAEYIRALPIFTFDDAQVSPLQCRAALGYVTKRHFGGVPPLVIVDYLQLEHVPNFRGSSTEEVAQLSNTWLYTCKAQGAAGLILSQLNRDAAGREPRLSDLKQSGAIEQDAQCVLLVWRPGVDDPKSTTANSATIALAKNRDGTLCYQPMHFTGYCVSFRPWVKERFKGDEEADHDLTHEAMIKAEAEIVGQQTVQCPQEDLPLDDPPPEEKPF